MGMISLEDIIEEIVGDISDEFDDEELIYSKLDDSTYVFDAKINLKDFFKVIEIEEDEVFEKAKGESESLAGFILELAQVLPKMGQVISFNSYQFIIESVDRKRIKRVKVILPKKYDWTKFLDDSDVSTEVLRTFVSFGAIILTNASKDVRKISNAKFISITGSSGKTSLKDLLAFC